MNKPSENSSPRKSSSSSPKIDPELEARIVALVLGEASDLERDQLEREIKKSSALTWFRDEMQRVHGMLSEVETGESIPQDAQWKLPAKKRDVVLAAINGDPAPLTPNPNANRPVRRLVTSTTHFLGPLAKMAAVVGGLGFFGWLVIPSMGTVRERRKSIDQVAAIDDFFESGDGLPMPAESLNRSDSHFYVEGKEELEQVWQDVTTPQSPPTSAPILAPATEQPHAPTKEWGEQENQRRGRRFATQEASPGSIQLGVELKREEDRSGDGLLDGVTFDFDDGQFRSKLANVDGARDALSINGLGDQSLKENSVSRRFTSPSIPQAGKNYFFRSDDLSRGGLGGGGGGGFGGGDQQKKQRGRSQDRSKVELGDDGGANSEVASRESSLFDELRQSRRDRSEAVEFGAMLSADGKWLHQSQSGREHAPVAGTESVSGGVANQPKSDRQPNHLNEEYGLPRQAEKLRRITGEQLAENEILSSDGIVANQTIANAARPATEAGRRMLGRRSLADSGPTSMLMVTPRILFVEESERVGLPPIESNEKNAQRDDFSTFSLHISDVSFKLARAALAQGQWPEPEKVRVEEFVNAFDYGDPLPREGEKVACRLEQVIHPFRQQRNLLRVSLRTAATGRASQTPLRLTLLLDHSGSMERPDRKQTIQRAFQLLTDQLRPSDQVTLIAFAAQTRLLAEQFDGTQARRLVQMVHDLPSEGGTNLEAALRLAQEKALEQYRDDAQNRVVLLTDGAVNLGDADPESLSEIITRMRTAGVAFDAAGIRAAGLNDETLETLTRQGDGRYYLLDSLESADDGFARQIAGALRPSAKNVKVQVEFNPKRVGQYKLLGFEKHRLQQKDFRNDNVDAAEMAAAEAGVAMYQVQVKPDGEGDIGSVSVRFRDQSTGQMIENRWPIPYQPSPPRLEEAPASMRIASAAAFLAVKLRGQPLAESIDLKSLAQWIAGFSQQNGADQRVQQLQQMIEQAQQLNGQ